MARRTPSARDLSRITARYLEHRATSAAHLRQLLLGRFRRADDYDPDQSEGYDQLVAAEIARLVASGALDDEKYAEARTRTLRRRGTSGVRIRGALRAKGLDREVIDGALAPGADPDVDTDVDPELEAARTWARKHRVGPWRVAAIDADAARRELGRFVRAGFPYAIVRSVLGAAADPDDDG